MTEDEAIAFSSRVASRYLAGRALPDLTGQEDLRQEGVIAGWR